jgi:hypothetical protein
MIFVIIARIKVIGQKNVQKGKKEKEKKDIKSKKLEKKV